MSGENKIFLQKKEKEQKKTKTNHNGNKSKKFSAREKQTLVYSIIMGVLLLFGVVLAVLYAVGVIRTPFVFVIFILIILINYGITRHMNQANSNN